MIIMHARTVARVPVLRHMQDGIGFVISHWVVDIGSVRCDIIGRCHMHEGMQNTPKYHHVHLYKTKTSAYNEIEDYF
jgi:hypothetical protein